MPSLPNQTANAPTDLSIIIVNWNVAELLAKCLASIEKHLSHFKIEVFVIDNASEDESLAVVEQSFPWVQIIANSENTGFAKANNQGFQKASGTYILTLNPDTEIQAGALDAMVELLEKNPKIGIVGPQIISSTGKIVRACKRKAPSLRELSKNLFLTETFLDFFMNKVFPKGWSRLRDQTFSESGPCDCIQGSCMLMRKTDLQRIGIFDERIPMYLDDNDLCTRFRKAGLTVFFQANAQILHSGARSVSKLANSRISSLVGSMALDMYFLKHGSKWQVAVHHCLLVFSSLIFLGVDLLLLPFLWVSKQKFIKNYIVKHWWSLYYGIFFAFKTSSLPPCWPRSLKAAVRANPNISSNSN